jgi:hypothetical protein
MNEDTYKEALQEFIAVARDIVDQAYFQTPKYEPDNLPDKCMIDRKNIEDLDTIFQKAKRLT